VPLKQSQDSAANVAGDPRVCPPVGTGNPGNGKTCVL